MLLIKKLNKMSCFVILKIFTNEPMKREWNMPSHLVVMCMLSRCSHVWLFATLWTLPARLLCPWHSPGKSTGLSCHALLQGIFPTQGFNWVSYVSCTDRRVFSTSATWEAHLVLWPPSNYLICWDALKNKTTKKADLKMTPCKMNTF